MFFKYVYGKIQQSPYLHIVTWGLPRRYFGLLRIFNLQIAEHPHQFLNQCSESFNDYESPSTSKSPSILKPSPLILKDDVSKYECKLESKEEPFVAQDADGDRTLPPSRSNRRPSKKPVLSIRIRLHDDVKNLRKKKRCQNLGKLLSKGNPKTYFLVLEKRPSSKSGGYSLNIIDSAYGQPYSKLLKRNRRKKTIPAITRGTLDPDTCLNVPSELVPFENTKSEEKPMRNLPIITQVFTDKNMEIYKNLFSSVTLNETEHEEKEVEIGKDTENTPVTTTCDESLVETVSETEVKPVETKEETKEESSVHLSLFSRIRDILNSKNRNTSNLSSKNIEESSKLPNISNSLTKMGSSSTPASQKVFTSTLYLLINNNGNEQSDNQARGRDSQNAKWTVTQPKSSLINKRLLSSSVKTYESIIIPCIEDENEIIDTVTEEGQGKENLTKSNYGDLDMTNSLGCRRRAFIICVVIASLVIFGLGVTFIVSLTNTSRLFLSK